MNHSLAPIQVDDLLKEQLKKQNEQELKVRLARDARIASAATLSVIDNIRSTQASKTAPEVDEETFELVKYRIISHILDV